MTDRIHFSAGGLRISKRGYDAKTAPIDKLSLYPGMSSMTQIAGGTVTVAGNSRQRITFTNTQQRLPYVILGATDGSPPDRDTYCGETQPPYNYVDIRNETNSSKTINYGVLIDNVFI